MNVMIFAAGLGTRLRPLTDHCPKALVPVEGKPLLEHLLTRLRAGGFTRVVVNVHHFADQVIQFLDAHQGFGMDVTVSDERELLLDTGGGIRKAWPLFADREPVLIHNVDIVSDIDLAGLYCAHTEAAQTASVGATLAVAERKTSRYLLFDDDMRLCGWKNVATGQLRGREGTHAMAFSGVHVVDAALLPMLQQVPQEVFSITDFYLNVCEQMPLRGVDVSGVPWVDCGKPESLALASAILRDR